MLELVSMIRPLGHWHVLLAICLLDLALITFHLSGQGQEKSPGASDAETATQLESVRQSLALEEQRQLVLMERVRDIVRSRGQSQEELDILIKGVSVLERQIDRLNSDLSRVHSNGDVPGMSREVVVVGASRHHNIDINATEDKT